jgi:hypothetical protein
VGHCMMALTKCKQAIEFSVTFLSCSCRFDGLIELSCFTITLSMFCNKETPNEVSVEKNKKKNNNKMS